MKSCYRVIGFFAFLKLLISFFPYKYTCIHADIVGPFTAYLHHALHILWPAGGSKGQAISAHSKRRHVNKTRMSVTVELREKPQYTGKHTITLSFTSKNKKIILTDHNIRHLLYLQKSQSLHIKMLLRIYIYSNYCIFWCVSTGMKDTSPPK